MKALLLAAGRGTRFAPLGNNIPKPMIPIAGKPLLERALEQVRACGIHTVYINLHHQADVIREHFGNGERWGVGIHYSFEPEPLGTAGAAAKLREELDCRFVVYYGDNLCSFDLAGMARFHDQAGAHVTILADESYDGVAGGVIECTPEGCITSFLEKPACDGDETRLENGGVYILEPSVRVYIPREGKNDFGRDVFPAMLRAGEPLYCYRAEGYVRGIDTPERYHNLLREIREGSILI